MNGFIIFCVLLGCGFFFGRAIEKSHYRSIIEREQKLAHLPDTSMQMVNRLNNDAFEGRLVQAGVVISVDYFKRVVAALINVFGGTLKPYESLLDRARREAVLRLKESCPDAVQIINLRIETSSISKGSKNQIGCVEVLAYGTAIFKSPPQISRGLAGPASEPGPAPGIIPDNG
jgi:uncharacterized protein YbjQ (UPF0145 family)